MYAQLLSAGSDPGLTKGLLSRKGEVSTQRNCLAAICARVLFCTRSKGECEATLRGARATQERASRQRDTGPLFTHKKQQSC